MLEDGTQQSQILTATARLHAVAQLAALALWAQVYQHEVRTLTQQRQEPSARFSVMCWQCVTEALFVFWLQVCTLLLQASSAKMGASCACAPSTTYNALDSC